MNRATRLYFLLAYILTWCAWVPLALQGQGVLSGVPSWLHLAGAYGPFVAAFIVTAGTAGRQGVRELLSRLARWRIGWGWLLIAALSPVAVFGAVVLVMRLVTGTWQAAGGFGQVAELPGLGWLGGWLAWILTFGLGEETGWRGFALPRLQARHSARDASLILGLLWAGWHAPAFFYNNYALSLFSVVAFVVSIVAGAMVLTWLYNSTGGSVLATILWHGSYNAAVAGGDAVVSAVVTAAVIVAFILIVRRYGPETLSSRPKHVLAGL